MEKFRSAAKSRLGSLHDARTSLHLRLIILLFALFGSNSGKCILNCREDDEIFFMVEYYELGSGHAQPLPLIDSYQPNFKYTNDSFNI
ncbi:uncharacterized protein LOC143177745 isoform X4 [Calliopsis andreniformis]|uniref:uncharacterized protein LOC143177745 isoform X4 n=1 Tax=Calliopsis andreniformis TaxID=337506 RepID=UPI003FCE94E5